MVKQTIQIFLRVKPTKNKTGFYEIDEDDDHNPLIRFQIPKELADGYINNKKENFKFRFSKIFDRPTKQDEIFENVAQPVVDNVLSGYNGTIFAYGQTGSGKTFTITGGAERYMDRGIIPRTLSYMFQCYSKQPDFEFTTHVSYLEIYNESGYDLLDPKHEATKLEDLPKVSLMEDSDQNIHLRNLTTHQASSEEEALNLLFLGDTNRMIAETPMNQASTRSHCIFTIHVSSKELGSATVKRAKLHLVDLAGSERVGKTGVNGQLLTEAKYINLSLHYLEQVIVALSEKTRQHIPYRNSLMTSVLRDSLGGNCMTTMIATCSVEQKNIAESVSTCRFAQRVALIKNDALLNEELDPKLLIAKLKREVQQLREELAMLTGEQRTDALSEEDLERCQEAVDKYLQETDPDITLNIGTDMRKIHHCFHIMKKMIREKAPLPVSQAPAAESDKPATPVNEEEEPTDADPKVIKKLKEQLRQRDNEINILVNMLKKEKKRYSDAAAELERLGAGPLSSRQGATSSQSGGRNSVYAHGRGDSASSESSEVTPPNLSNGRRSRHTPGHIKGEEIMQKKILGNLSMGRQEAYEIFRRDYEHNQTIDDNKSLLKQRYAEAKQLGETVNQARSKINKLKSSIEQHRMSMVMQGLVDPNNPEPDDLELEMREQIDSAKDRYKESFQRLRTLKTEIEHLQHLLERSKVKLMKDFEFWWAEQAAVAQEQQQRLENLPTGKHKAAWRTPPVSPHDAADHKARFIDQQIKEERPPSRDSRLAMGQSSSGYSSQDSSRSRHRSSTQNTGPSIPMTGDPQADADIMAFMKARQSIFKKAQEQGHR